MNLGRAKSAACNFLLVGPCPSDGDSVNRWLAGVFHKFPLSNLKEPTMRSALDSLLLVSRWPRPLSRQAAEVGRWR
jgi:hypothetical protein